MFIGAVMLGVFPRDWMQPANLKPASQLMCRIIVLLTLALVVYAASINDLAVATSTKTCAFRRQLRAQTHSTRIATDEERLQASDLLLKLKSVIADITHQMDLAIKKRIQLGLNVKQFEEWVDDTLEQFAHFSPALMYDPMFQALVKNQKDYLELANILYDPALRKTEAVLKFQELLVLHLGAINMETMRSLFDVLGLNALDLQFFQSTSFRIWIAFAKYWGNASDRWTLFVLRKLRIDLSNDVEVALHLVAVKGLTKESYAHEVMTELFADWASDPDKAKAVRLILLPRVIARNEPCQNVWHAFASFLKEEHRK